ncbi:hypothetical protein TNCV_1782121 [Trichonephila clavipes]|nr:hypothetical protein TNCV_1782121 [Trichonephila clavipes]
MGAEVHEQMSQSGGQSEARPPVFKSPSKLSTHLSTHCRSQEVLRRPWALGFETAAQHNVDYDLATLTTSMIITSPKSQIYSGTNN